MRNRTDLGPIINGSVVSPQEAFTGATPSINHMRVWGSKCCLYVNPKIIPPGQHHDKLINLGRIDVFMGFLEIIHKQFKVYLLEFGYTS